MIHHAAAGVPDGINFAGLLLCFVSSGGANYGRWQLLKGVLMSSFWMDTSNIRGLMRKKSRNELKRETANPTKKKKKKIWKIYETRITE